MMKNKLRKTLTALLAMLLVCVSLVSVFAMPVSAAEGSGEVQAPAAPKKRPTYTDTLAENNDLLKKLDEKLSKHDEKENKVLAKVKQQGVDWINFADMLIKTAKDDDADQADWADVSIELITAIAGIWGFDDLTETVFTKLEDTLSSGEAPLSEVQILTDTMMQQFNGMNDHLYDIEDQLAALSNEVLKNANSIINATQTQINNLNSKMILREFMMSGAAGFSYLNYSNYLYGVDNLYTSSSEAYYIRLLEAIHNNKSPEQIKEYFDRFFDSVYNNVGSFNQYYFGEVIGMENKSVAMYYYDYLSYNPDLLADDTSAEYEAIMFALELYTTYAYTYELLEICYSYQLKQMDNNGTDEYVYNPEKAPVTAASLRSDIAKIDVALKRAEEQAVENIAYILGMGDSYVVLDNGGLGDARSIGNYGDTFGNLANGQIVFLNVLPGEIGELFFFDANSFTYYVNGVEYTAADKGIIDPKNIRDSIFTVTVKYGSTELYSIDFTKIDEISLGSSPIYEFSGGSGTEDDPYLISNAVQLDMIANDLGAHYQLICDIMLTGTRTPIGNEKKPFTGLFDGNGYMIKSLTVESNVYDSTNITMTPTTGMFGTVGRGGVVMNLTLDNLTVISDYTRDGVNPENPVSYYFVGGIAGVNRGIISNCSITGTSTVTVDRNKSIRESRCVEIYVGGIVGSNNGVIEYSSTDGLAIYATSHLYYYAEGDSQNTHSLYVGGIAGTSANVIKHCRVSQNSLINAYLKSVAEDKNKKYPYLTLRAGGIVGDELAKGLLTNVYSSCNFERVVGEIYNEATKWGVHRYYWDHVDVKCGDYYPVYFPLSSSDSLSAIERSVYQGKYDKNFNKDLADLCAKHGCMPSEAPYYVRLAAEESASLKTKSELRTEEAEAVKAARDYLGTNIASSYDSEIFTLVDDTYGVKVELHSNVCEMNTNFITECFNKIIDPEKKTKNVKFVDTDGNVVDAVLVGYYGFYTYHENEKDTDITVKALFYVEGKLMSDDVVLTVKANALVNWGIIGFTDTAFEKGSSVEECLDIIFEHGFTLFYEYSNGQRREFFVNSENRNAVDIYNLNTFEYGEKTVTVYHNEQPVVGKLIKFEQTVTFACNHSADDFVKVGTVPATCRLLGYEIWKCQKGGEGCGKEIHKNYFSGDHTYVVIGGQHATCHEPGYTQQVHCSVCNKVFESSEWIQALPHAYVSGNSAEYVSNASYPASDYHYCTSGNHYEAHQYTVREQIDDNGTLVYVYTCFCGYEHPIRDTNIKTDESGKMPTVIVTNGYVLEVGDEVVVYVQILNNPGFKGATFGIRYTDGLELLSAEESSIVPQQLKVKNEVYCGYNFLWAMGDGNRTTADGYLLKLTFRYVDTAEREQGIAVVYGMSNGSSGGFCTLDGEYSMFKTESGTVTVVDHLPGDVNSDNRVDVMDATHIAWSIVGHLDANGNRFTVNPKYADVNLDGNIDLVDVLLILQSISGRYGTSLLNSEYKLIFDLNGFVSNDVDESVTVQFYDESGNRTKWSENLDFAMYEAFMQRLGYNFVGWYTRMDCTCASDCTHRVADSELVSYDKYQSAQTLYARWEKNKVSFEMNGATSGAIGDVFYDPSSSTVKFSTPSLSYAIDYHVTGYEGIYKTLPIYKNFEGWYIESTDISVSELDLATPNLGTVKVVARWSDYVWNKPSEERAGYSDVTSWYYKNQYADEFKVSVMDDAAIENLISLGSNLYGRENPIEYTITYGNAYGLDYINDSKCFVTDTVILKSLPDRTGYKFAGWIDENGNPVTVISSTTQNRVITAKWKAKVYTITVKGIEETKYTADTGAVDLNRKGNPVYDEGLLTNTKFTLYFTYGDDGVPGFYTTYDNGVLSGALNGKALENMMNNAGLYENFVFGGFYYGGTITDNGHSYASTGTNTAIVSADGSLIYDFAKDTVSKFNESTETGTLYALIIPKQYTINFALNAPAYGVTGSTGYTTSVKAYHNESLATVNIVMPSNTYYRSTYVYNGFEYYGFDGKSTALANFPQHDKDYAVTLTAYWGTDRAINDTTYHASAYSYIYYVKNANDLNQVRNYPSASYMLLTNVTLSGEWTPIPNFSGSFNGNYKYIKGLSICKYSPATVNSETNFGLFANITSTAQIYNLDIYDASIYFDPQHGGSGWINAGFIAGTGNGTITNVRVYNSNLTIHRNQSRYGGIIGNCTGGTISNCTVFGINLNGNGDSGGIVGRLAGTVSGCKVTKSSSQNTTIRHYATESARSIGGICGYSEYGNTVSCHVSNTSFILDGDASLCPWFGKIVGHQQGGCIHYVGQEESTIYIKSEVALYTTNIFGGIKNDYRGHWFAVGWGFTGEASGEVSVK